MMITYAIEIADEMRPNLYSKEEKTRWLSELDGRIRNEILLGREGVEAGAPPDYHWQTDANKALLAEVPYDYLYTYWLFMRIDYLSGETTRFNNSAVLFNTAWMNYANFINRTHPLRTAGRVGGV